MIEWNIPALGGLVVVAGVCPKKKAIFLRQRSMPHSFLLAELGLVWWWRVVSECRKEASAKSFFLLRHCNLQTPGISKSLERRGSFGNVRNGEKQVRYGWGIQTADAHASLLKIV